MRISSKSLETFIGTYSRSKCYFSISELLLDLAAATRNYVSLSLCSLAKDFFTLQRIAVSWTLLHYEQSCYEHGS